MSRIKIVAIVLIAAGVLGLIYGGFTYTKETHDLKIGSLEVSVKDKETVNIPTWWASERSWSGSSCSWRAGRAAEALSWPSRSTVWRVRLSGV